ncbi:hypothetical protein PsunGV_gp078 [Pseudalatia unipuncta granulovirus]|jgi:hypothetical protein|uniref:Uncharacterized protein n=1 Tax=Pseudalatia unipuncta granulosis virus TaxID=36355 RepID=B6S6U7_GVPU|nr:hypothetical protein PsunGV_gp078 [Pseudalatia unipuncta granulovirus]ACH69428.1 unknown [Pseudalatia unipuncta granulovirus]
MSYKDLYQEIIRTQQDIAVTYQRLVAVENELKRNINESNTLPTNFSAKLDVLQQKVDLLLDQLLVTTNTNTASATVANKPIKTENVDQVESNHYQLEEESASQFVVEEVQN